MIVIVDSRKLMVSTSGLQIPLQRTPAAHQKTFLLADTWKYSLGDVLKKLWAKVIFVLGLCVHASSPLSPAPNGNYQIGQRNR